MGRVKDILIDCKDNIECAEKKLKEDVKDKKRK